MNVLLCSTGMLLSGWEALSKVMRNVENILLSDTAAKDFSSTLTKSVAWGISLVSLLVTDALSLLPWHTTVNMRAVAAVS